MEPRIGTVPWWLKAAVFVMFGLCIFMAAFLVIGIKKAREFQKARIARLEREGYQKITGDNLIATNPPLFPTWFTAASVKLPDGANAPVALYCATGEISGTVRADVLFVGRTLIINPGAILASNLETTCWMVKNFGELRGELRGTQNFYVTNRTPMTDARPRP